VPIPEVARQCGIFQSSSPSYLLLASIEGCLGLLEEQGEELFAAWSRRLGDFDRLSQGLKHLRLVGHGAEAGQTYPGVFALDPSKIVISTRHSALTGVELQERLREDYKIEVEMALGHYAVAMTGLGTDDTMAPRLAEALLALDEKYGPAQEPPEPIRAIQTLPPRVKSIEEAAKAPGGITFLYDGMGQPCGEYIWAYPPGIPLVTPGEVITGELVQTVEELYRAGVKLIGTRGKPPITVQALVEK
jgi:arginine/lysine/ornithine decarboxylase